MNNITKHPLDHLGYHFIPEGQIPEGENEYYLRNIQNPRHKEYRQLKAKEIELLVRNNNTSDNWNQVLVSDAFNPLLVKNCNFFGLVRIGKLEPYYLSYHNLRMPVGIYNSTIISCDIGDNVVIDEVTYLSHYIIGDEVVIVNVNEMATTNYAKFGNGILKEGEEEKIRIWLELRNENGGRKIIPFQGMRPADAFLWTEKRDDKHFQEQLKKITTNESNKKRGWYGTVGHRSIIKNTRIIKDVKFGEEVYVKGANKLKNLTVSSTAKASTQIGEGCELVNGIIGEGCRIFYGVKAVRFIMASHSQLKYGARLINSYLGNNATISCCEVLNALIFPFHEQHHNNSFLCAAFLQGQSNMAAGATIGSNHNSRAADGEMVAGRGFWPGLCVSIKHNSKFACFTILAKGDFMHELNISLPFSLVSNDVTINQLVIMPAYWFLYNLYAISRNAAKYESRDLRQHNKTYIETDYLAPDTIQEIIVGLDQMALWTGKSYDLKNNTSSQRTTSDYIQLGYQLLENEPHVVKTLSIYAEGQENSKRKVLVVKIVEAYNIYQDLILLNLVKCLIRQPSAKNRKEIIALIDQSSKDSATNNKLDTWVNLGGQLVTQHDYSILIEDIKSGALSSWGDIHARYDALQAKYNQKRIIQAIAAYEWMSNTKLTNYTAAELTDLFEKAYNIQARLTGEIRKSRAKDYENPFRSMIYSGEEEMNAVLGALNENAFIQQANNDLHLLRQQLDQLYA